ncbi:hypothetical protein FOA52_001096 [Chlamydomonas sp. UWO 241]|nr:hypothetical protein FOA52_001096 [Chlamydomonas sp. UWO 241]
MCPTNQPPASVSDLEAQASQALMMGSAACASMPLAPHAHAHAHTYAMASMHSAPSFFDTDELCSKHAVLRHCGSLDGPMGHSDYNDLSGLHGLHPGLHGLHATTAEEMGLMMSLAPSSPCSHHHSSPGRSHGGNGVHKHSASVMQFLLLDEEECGDGDGGCAAAQVPALAAPRAGKAVHVLGAEDLYCLAVMDEETGLPLRPATPEEVWEVERSFALPEFDFLTQQQQQQQTSNQTPAAAPAPRARAAPARASHGRQPRGEAAAAAAAARHRTASPPAHTNGGERGSDGAEHSRDRSAASAPARRPEPRRCGPCDNCHATESPQWRQGPPQRPMLCNACGMRFRRTNQLALPGSALSAMSSDGGGGAAASASAAAAAAAAAAAVTQRSHKRGHGGGGGARSHHARRGSHHVTHASAAGGGMLAAAAAALAEQEQQLQQEQLQQQQLGGKRPRRAPPVDYSVIDTYA